MKQLETFKAGLLFARTEGIIPAPETSHAIAAVIREAEKAKKEGTPKTILFNYSGHGLIDLGAYDKYFAGELEDHEVTDEEISKSLSQLETIILRGKVTGQDNRGDQDRISRAVIRWVTRLHIYML